VAPCSKDEFSCDGTVCHPKLYWCDEYPDCADGSDEANCGRGVQWCTGVYINTLCRFFYNELDENTREYIYESLVSEGGSLYVFIVLYFRNAFCRAILYSDVNVNLH